MFGPGMAQDVVALVSAIIIVTFLSAETLMESIPRLVQRDVAEFQNPQLALAEIVIVLIVDVFPLLNILRQKKKGPALKASCPTL